MNELKNISDRRYAQLFLMVHFLSYSNCLIVNQNKELIIIMNDNYFI